MYNHEQTNCVFVRAASAYFCHCPIYLSRGIEEDGLISAPGGGGLGGYCWLPLDCAPWGQILVM